MSTALAAAARAVPTALLACTAIACSKDSGPPPPELPPIENLGSAESAYVGSLQARVAANPSDDDAQLELAHALNSYGRWEAAARLYEHRTRVDPRDAEAWYHLGMMRAELGDSEGALAAYDACLALAPSGPETDWAAPHWRRGFLLLDADRLDEAEAAFERGRELSPEEPSPTLGLARVALQRDAATRAVELLEELVRSHPQDPRGRGLLARALREAGDPDRAADLASGATVDMHDVRVVDPWGATARLAAQNYEAALEASRAKLAAGDASGALAALRSVHAAQPDNIVVVEILTHAACAAGRFDAALTALNHPGLASEAARVAMNRGFVALRRGDANTAVEQLNEAVRLDPQLGLAHGLLGETLAGMRRPAQAIQALEAARRLGEEDARKAVLIGLLLIQTNQIEGAIVALERAASSYPEEPTAWTNLAVAYAQAQRWSDAHRALGRARAIAPDHEMIPRVAARLAELEAGGSGE